MHVSSVKILKTKSITYSTLYSHLSYFLQSSDGSEEEQEPEQESFIIQPVIETQTEFGGNQTKITQTDANTQMPITLTADAQTQTNVIF